jgi:CheY-like chemotaxis protein
MDINMPLMNGFETTQRLSKGIVTPVIALTFDKEEIIEEALSAGINDIIIKPFEPILLFKTINQLCMKKTRLRWCRSFYLNRIKNCEIILNNFRFI